MVVANTVAMSVETTDRGSCGSVDLYLHNFSLNDLCLLPVEEGGGQTAVVR